jgi:hypothetical protein
VADDVNDWHDTLLTAQLTLFPCPSVNVCAVLRLIEGPNPRAEAAAALELQTRRHDE